MEEVIEIDECDECGDPMDKSYLIRHFGSGYLICKVCIDEYHRIYMEKQQMNNTLDDTFRLIYKSIIDASNEIEKHWVGEIEED